MSVTHGAIGWVSPRQKRPPTVITLAELRARFGGAMFAAVLVAGHQGASAIARVDKPFIEPNDAPAWEELSLFDADEYGGRRCELCGKPTEASRIDARYCSTACRARSWRQEHKA